MKTAYTEGMRLGLTMEDSFTMFKHLLVKHSCQRPPFSTGIFDKADVTSITNYALDTFFRHYKM
jgi:hypothetical protein